MPTYSRRLILSLCDLIGFSLTAFLTFWCNGILPGSDGAQDYYKLEVVLAIWMVVCVAYFGHKGHYSWRTPWWQQVRHVLRTYTIAFVTVLLFKYVALPELPAEGLIISFWLLAIPSLLLMRWVGRAILKSVNHWSIPTILIGGIENVTETIYALRSELYLTYDIKQVAVVNGIGHDLVNLRALHPDLVIHETIDEILPRSMVILCPEVGDPEFFRNMIPKIKEAGAKLAIVPPTHGFSLYGLKPQFFFGHKIVLLESRLQLGTFWGRVAKGALDKTGALIGLILLSPLFIIVGRKVKKDGGPAFYGQRRIGQDGKEFKCWKFRSMIINAETVLEGYLAQNPEAREEWNREFKLKDDPRITPVGQFLRKSSLDEIPQLFNVLKGEMSLVGPRPIVQAEVHYYEDKIEHYMSVKPGITGLWQVSGRNDITYDQRVSLDTWYVENWSVWNDVVIILKTIMVVATRRGAY